jgi:hypothetical protein
MSIVTVPTRMASIPGHWFSAYSSIYFWKWEGIWDHEFKFKLQSTVLKYRLLTPHIRRLRLSPPMQLSYKVNRALRKPTWQP